MHEVAIINPLSKTVTGTYLVHDCQPAGLALGPNNRAVLGCAASFGSSPHILTQSIVIDITNGEVQANVTQVGGSDQVWYRPWRQSLLYGGTLQRHQHRYR